MTFEFAHNFLRKLMNVEWEQLPFLTEAQRDNFFANPHTFFIRADDETARKIWEVLYPKPPQARDGVAGWDFWRRETGDVKVIPFERKWSPEVRVGGIPPAQGTTADVDPHKTYTVN
ncbi:hypothetical protein [Bosea sp. FBZP-16]|uniref:hypothetical protein n=1 Tax=Bosea sp. FBZP-16 TaxID=2065382 RepID=UPI000C30F5E4|nr:hypothetical protein [Bosea sp. FBZP-16]